MDELISREAAIGTIEEYADRLQMVNWKENPNVPYKVSSLNWCINTIRDLPSADAVPVVRCKDCKYNLNNDRLFADPDPIMTYAWCNTEAFQENDFCSKGKRKEDE